MSNISYKFKQLNTAEQFIIINILVFVIQLFMVYILNISDMQIFEWVGLNNNIKVVITRFWTLLSYAFLHHNFSHIFWNMLLLYFMGIIFFNLFNRKLFLKIYLFGALSGSILFLIGSYFFTNGSFYLVGASASVMAVLIFLCTYVPHYQITLPFNIRIQLWVFGLIIFGLDIIQISSNNPGGHFAHLGGALLGFLYALQIKRGKSTRKLNFFKKKKTQTRKRSFQNPSKNHINRIHQQKIDAILDKISKSGYESLSNAEKEYLFKAKDH